jgi:hypothetical protein
MTTESVEPTPEERRRVLYARADRFRRLAESLVVSAEQEDNKALELHAQAAEHERLARSMRESAGEHQRSAAWEVQEYEDVNLPIAVRVGTPTELTVAVLAAAKLAVRTACTPGLGDGDDRFCKVPTVAMSNLRLAVAAKGDLT